MSSFVCFICSEHQPLLVLNVHHVRPQAAGGSNEPSNLVNLCRRCHDGLHATEVALRTSKRAGGVEDQLALLFPTNIKARLKCIELAKQAHHWFRQKREGSLAPSKNATERMQISLTPSQKLLLKTAAQDASMSMNDYLTLLVSSHLNSKFPKKA